MAFPFFYVGYIDKKLFQSGRGLILQFTTSSNWMICSIILLMLSVIIGFCNKEICGSIYTLDMYSGNYNNVMLSFLSAFFGIYGICIICSKVKLPILSHIGKRSIVYFACHFNIFIPLIKKYVDINCKYMIVQHIIVFLITCILSEICYFVISKIPFRNVLGIR